MPYESVELGDVIFNAANISAVGIDHIGPNGDITLWVDTNSGGRYQYTVTQQQYDDLKAVFEQRIRRDVTP